MRSILFETRTTVSPPPRGGGPAQARLRLPRPSPSCITQLFHRAQSPDYQHEGHHQGGRQCQPHQSTPSPVRLYGYSQQRSKHPECTWQQLAVAFRAQAHFLLLCLPQTSPPVPAHCCRSNRCKLGARGSTGIACPARWAAKRDCVSRRLIHTPSGE